MPFTVADFAPDPPPAYSPNLYRRLKKEKRLFERKELRDGEDGMLVVPIHQRFLHCEGCGAFLDVGWNGFQTLDPDR